MARKKKKKTKLPLWLSILLIIALAIGGNDLKALIDLDGILEPTEQPVEQIVLEGLEIPTASKGKQGQIIQRTGYTLAYDKKTKTPQWVAWELTKEETNGNHERTDKFYMSNICPQIHHLNTGDWNELEANTRKWARRYGRVYVTCGPIYNGNRRTEYIGKNRVKVPDAFFKVILIQSSKKTCALGFYFENEAGQRPLNEYLVSVDYLEQMTGIDFFPALPDELENTLEAETHNSLP